MLITCQHCKQIAPTAVRGLIALVAASSPVQPSAQAQRETWRVPTIKAVSVGWHIVSVLARCFANHGNRLRSICRPCSHGRRHDADLDLRDDVAVQCHLGDHATDRTATFGKQAKVIRAVRSRVGGVRNGCDTRSEARDALFRTTRMFTDGRQRRGVAHLMEGTVTDFLSTCGNKEHAGKSGRRDGRVE
eukprot:5169759-Pleurochrysis_carterae.AAC.1